MTITNAERCRIWRQNNPERVIENNRRYRQNNRKKIKEHARKYRQNLMKGYENLAQLLLNYARSSASSRGLKCTLTKEYLQKRLERCGYCCEITGLPFGNRGDMDLTAASIDRINSDGDYTPRNIQLVHLWINLAKGKHKNKELLPLIKEAAKNL